MDSDLPRPPFGNILFFGVFTAYSRNKLDSNRETAAYISVMISFVTLTLIVIYHIYTYTTIFLKFKAGRMVERLLTESETSRKTKQLNVPLDDDIHRFNELIDIIDRPVKTDD